MRRRRLIGTLFTAAAVTLSLLSLSCASSPPSATATAKPDPVVRGRYLVTIMSCNDCHTPGTFYGAPDTLRRLSGSELGWVGPWGVVHARNLTPDSATGIGSWTIDQIVTALRSGNTPSGVQLAAIMPWQNYSNILDQDDAVAIASYLKSLPPVKHKNLDRIPPGQKPTGANIAFPPPPAWEVPPGGAPGGGKK
jgi:mono/diheme cytochrome c family protein